MPDLNNQGQHLDEPVRPATTPPIELDPTVSDPAVPDATVSDATVSDSTVPDSTVPAPPRSAEPKPSLPRTRVGSAWVGLCALAIVAIAFIIFMLQNTGRVHVTFLSMHASLPLALALLIAAVAGVLIVLAVGTVRITQLRRMAKRRNRAGTTR